MAKKVVGDVTPDDVKKHLVMFVAVIQTVINWIPGEVGVKVKRVGELLVGIATQEWFVGLITYLLNTFQDKPITEADLGKALAHYGKEVEEGKRPVNFDLK